MIAGILLFLQGVPRWAYEVLGVILLAFCLIFYGEHRQAAKDAVKIAAVKKEFADFKADVAAKGKAAQAASDKQKAADIAAKESADAENSKSIAKLRADNQRLLNARSNANYLPAPAKEASAASVAEACFNRADTESAIKRLDAGIQGLVSQGDEAITDLNTAKVWAAH